MAPVSEIRVATRGRHIVRKRFPKTFDAALQENKHLAQVPYNVCNKRVTLEDLDKIFSSLGMEVQVRDLATFQTAFVHRSYLHETLQLDDTATARVCETPQKPQNGQGSSDPAHADLDPDLRRAIPVLLREGYVSAGYDFHDMMPLQSQSGERLEYLGDSVCGCSVASYLYHRFPDEDEGFMTRLKTRLVNGARLGEFAEKLGLQEFAVLSRYVEHVNNGRRNFKILEDIFESFVGALFVDQAEDYKICNDFMVRVMEKFVDFPGVLASDENYKDILLRWYQKHYDGVFPRYKELLVETVDNVKVYTMAVLSPDGNTVMATASSRRKRAAEQASSRIACQRLGIFPPDDNAGDDTPTE